MEIKRHEVVFDNNGIPDVYKAGIIRQGSKNVDMLSVRFENYNDMEMVAVLGGERADGEKVPPGLLFIPEKEETTGYVWYNFIFGQQEDEGNPNSWFTEIDNDLLLNIRLVKGKQVYVDSQIKMEVEYDSGFETGGDYNWDIISGFLEALSFRATYEYVDSEIEKVIIDIVALGNDLQAHKSDTLAHNIPSQIDSKINTHNTNGISHQDLRTGLSEVQSVATDNKTKLDTIEVGATADQTPAEIKIAYELNANTNAFTDLDKTKLEQIEAKAQVNKIETIIVNGIEQAIIEKGVNLTTDIHNMIVEEIDNVVGSSPELLDTLQELANAINNDPNFATTITNEIASKVSKNFNKYAEKATLTGSEYLVINDNGVIKRVLTDLVRNDKLTAENIPSGKGTTISEELDKKVDIDLIETQLPDNLVYSDDLEEIEEPLTQVYNSQLLNDKQESELDVNSAIKDGDNNVITDTYYKKTDTVDKSTNSENADKLLQDGSYVGSQFLNVAYATSADSATTSNNALNSNKLNNKTESELNVASADSATNASNANKLNNKLESELNVASADSADNALNADKLNNKEESELSVYNSQRLGGKFSTLYALKKEVYIIEDVLEETELSGEGDIILTLNNPVLDGDTVEVTFSGGYHDGYIDREKFYFQKNGTSTFGKSFIGAVTAEAYNDFHLPITSLRFKFESNTSIKVTERSTSFLRYIKGEEQPLMYSKDNNLKFHISIRKLTKGGN